MDNFCGSEFWNKTLAWDTNPPSLSDCFQRSVLVFVPCAFLWIFSPFDVTYIRKSRNPAIQWNIKIVLKLKIIILMVLLSLSEFVTTDHVLHPVDIFSPILTACTMALSGILVYTHRRRGVVTSGVLFLFFILQTLFSIPRGISPLSQSEASAWETANYVCFKIFFACSILMLLLNCFADQIPTGDIKNSSQTKPCPEESSSFLSHIFFSWFDKLAWLGYKQPLEQNNLWNLRTDDKANSVIPIFMKYWTTLLAQSKVQTTKNGTPKPASILPPIYKAFGQTFLFGALFKLLNDLLMFISPQILRLIIQFVEDHTQAEWKGILYTILIFGVAGLQTMLMGQYFHRMFTVGLRIRTALISAIYRKALVMSNSARNTSTVGEIVNLMAVDAQRFIDLATYINLIWSAPLQIGLALYFLWDILGPSVLAGLAFMIILLPVNGFIANKVKKLQVLQMKYKDERVKLMNEVLNGIKVLKLYAWEPSFEEKILKIRSEEIGILRKTVYLNASTSLIWTCSSNLVALITFATYVLIDENNVLDPTTAFVSLSLFNILRFPLAMLPNLVTSLIQSSVSIKRLNKFMNNEELNSECVQHENTEGFSLTLSDASFSWIKAEAILHNITMKVPTGSLVAIVGPVGSGKSSLISACLGEMNKLKGGVNTFGKIAYVSQQAWIQNASLKNNILFDNPMDSSRYNRVLRSCALLPDLEILPGGDETEIGEKGINLSGGQKQRVSLARAAYSDADIYFMDDPLSAVDSHVGKHLYEKVIGNNGMLKNKTRILVTHSVNYLPHVDQIFVMKNGMISEYGDYHTLLEKKGDFADFLNTYMSDINDGAESSVDTPQPTSAVNLTAKPYFDEAPKQTDKLIEEEKSKTGNVKLHTYKYYLKHIGVCTMVVTLIVNILFRCFWVGSSLWLSQWSSDENAINDTSVQDMYLGVYGAFSTGQVILTVFVFLIPQLGLLFATSVLHKNLLHQILRAPLSFFDTTPIGRILSRFSKDTEVLDVQLPSIIHDLIMCFFEMIAILIVISVSTVIFMVVILPIGLLYYFIQRFYVATSRQLKRLESVSRSPIYSHFGESLSGASVIRAFGVQERFSLESEKRVDINQRCLFPSMVANRWLAVRLEIIGNFILLFAALFSVLGRDTISPGIVGLSISYAMTITAAMNWLVRMTSELESNIVAVERIKEYSEIEQEALWKMEDSEDKTDNWPKFGNIEFSNFQVRYREGLDLVLNGISFKVKVGEKVGIVGRTGAGKSSLSLAIFRILEASGGTIHIDDTDISKLGLHDLRSNLTIIPQDPVLFSGTLRLNLDPFLKHTEMELWNALRHAHLYDFVQKLQAGLDHEVSEGGENLSLGQRQLICLGRALLRKSKILILDEATAAVDLETDDLIQATIRNEFKDCTILTVAHRLNTIIDSDRIIVLHQGQIIENASPKELLQNQHSAFYSMAQDAGII